MATIPVVTPSLAGKSLTPTAATAGPDTLTPQSGRPTVLIINNGGGTAITVTAVVPGNTQYGQAQPDVTSVSIAAGAHGAMLLPPDIADPSTGLISVTASATASVSFYAIRG